MWYSAGRSRVFRYGNPSNCGRSVVSMVMGVAAVIGVIFSSCRADSVIG
jgi:hypothetical protein